MTIEQLKNFLAVAEILNFHKASNKMYIAQPALSRQIKNLEEEVAAELFDRTKKQIRLTAAGVFFQHEVTRILKHLSEAQRRTGLIHRGEAGDINIGHVSSAMQSVLPYFLKTVTTNHPHLNIGLMENSCGIIFSKILDRELHFGITPDEESPAGIESILLYKENFVIVTPKNMKVDFKGTAGLKAFAKADWILPAREDGHGYHDMLFRLFRKHGFTPKVVFQSPNAATNLRMVGEGLGVTIIGKSAVEGVKLNIKSYELTDVPTKVEMRFMWLRERTDELKEYIELFMKIFKEKVGTS
jgi:DNA-binding transcriptional LysR family regulator